MKKLVLVIPLLLCGSPPAQARKVSVDDLMALRSISDVRISPDGKSVAYVVSSASFEKDAYEPVLYVISAEGGKALRLTYTTRIFNQPVPAPQLRWSPDGSQLSFLGFVNEVPQVMAMSASGGEPRALTAGKDGVNAYEWSPDGARIAYVSPNPASEEEERRKKDKSYVIEVDRNLRAGRIWIQDVAGGVPRAITPATQFVSSLCWSPDAGTIVYSAAPTSGFTAQYQTRLYSVPTSGGEPRLLVDRPGINTSPQYSPDGKRIAFISSEGRAEMMSIRGLHVIMADGSPSQAIKNLSAVSRSWVGAFAWDADSRSIFYIPVEGTGQRGEHMFEQPILRVWVESGRTERLTPGSVANFSLSLSRNGKRMAYRSVEARSMGDVFVRTADDGRTQQLTNVNPELRDIELGDLKPIRWKSFDGMEIWGLLLTPPGHQPGKRVPLVVYCHGGPIGGVTYGVFPQFMHTIGQVDPYPAQAMASAGMAILFPMPRGGSGYGEEGFRMIINSWGEGDYKDIMAGVDYLIAEGIADPDRLGVMGASYGGFMTNWIVTQTGRFKAASTMCSISDLADLYYLSDAGDFVAEYFRLPWEATETYAAHSPIHHAQRVTTPLLIQHGEKDARVPIMQAQKFYKALKELKKTVEMEIYPRGGHVIYEPDLQREMMRRNLEWFSRWLIHN